MTASRIGGSSGIAATAAEMPARRFSPAGLPRANPSPTVMTMRPIATTSRIFTSRSSSVWSGDRRRPRDARLWAIRPNSVAVPMATMRPSPRPPTMLVPLYAIE